MKQKERKALHDKTVPELHLLLKDLRSDVTKLLLGVNKVKNVHEARMKKKDIARILTILQEKGVSERV